LVAGLPSKAFATAPFSRTVSSQLAVTRQVLRGSGASRLTSTALVHPARFPASDSAISRTNRVRTGANVAVFCPVASGHVAAATGADHADPSGLTRIS
jgi:hypothetical protein